MLLSNTTWGSPSDPPALLVHGAIDASTTWARVGAWLGERGWHAIAVDLRGHGASALDRREAADRSLRPFAEDLVETVSALRGDAPGVDLLVGHSLGTLVSLECVARHPSFARRLVLEDPPGQSIDFHALAAQVRERIGAARADPAGVVEDALATRDPRVDPDSIRDKVAAIAAADEAYVAGVLERLTEVDMASLARMCRLPTLVIVGRDMGAPPYSASQEEFARFSALSGQDRVSLCAALSCELVELDAGHDVHQTVHADFVKRLGGWLAADRRRSSAVNQRHDKQRP
jgi:pimeloyl-ACP methyl ester carboxylesterase